MEENISSHLALQAVSFPPCPPALILTRGAKKQRWLDKYFFARLLHPHLFNVEARGCGGRDPLEEGRWLNIFSTDHNDDNGGTDDHDDGDDDDDVDDEAGTDYK